MFSRLAFLTTILTSIIFLSCTAWLGTENGNSDGKGSVLVAASLEKTNSSELRATAHTKLFLRLLDDSDNVLKDTVITKNDAVILCDMGKIPAQKEYSIIAWTEDAAGVVIHSPDTQFFEVETNSNCNVLITLQPRVGSIIAQFTGNLTSIDSFFLSFDSDSGFFETRVPRATYTYLTLDNVPYGAKGNLSFKIQNKDKSFLIERDEFFTFLRENVSLEFSFANNGEINMSLVVNNPYNTIITGIGDPKAVLGKETNMGVVITEFAYNYGTNRHFVEVANLSGKKLTFDDLTIETVNSSKSSTSAKNVTLLPQETIVFANSIAKDFWESKGVSVFGALYLVAGGSIIMLKGDGILLDYVMYVGDNNSGWAKPSTRTSLYLKELNGDPKFNNIPANWRVSTDTIMDGTTIYYGTPGKLK